MGSFETEKISSEWIKRLNEKYLIDETKLKKLVKIKKEIIGLESASEISIIQPDGQWKTTSKVNVYPEMSKSTFKGQELFTLREEYHWAIYGPDKIIVSLKDKEYEFDSLAELEKNLPEISMFVVIIYGAHETIGVNAEIQKALKKFALDFGKYVESEVIVIDYWTKEEFNYKQYKMQEEKIMKTFNIPNDACPSILVSNVPPSSWNEAGSNKKSVLIHFKNYNPSEIGSKLRKLSDNLEDLKMPSVWGERWDCLIKWCKDNGVFSTAFGIVINSL